MNPPRNRPWMTWAILALVVGVALVVWLLLFRTVASNRIYMQPSASMLPTLDIKEKILVDLNAYKSQLPNHGDIVVFNAPKIALHPDQNEAIFVKRLIGREGDLIEIKKGVLFRNGAKVDEPYIRNPIEGFDFKLVEMGGQVVPLMSTLYGVNSPSSGTVEAFLMRSSDEESKALKLKAVKIPAGKLFVMGDNRENSSDSRMWGLVDAKSLIGRASKIE